MKVSVRQFPGNFLNNLQQALADNPSNQKKRSIEKNSFLRFNRVFAKKEEKRRKKIWTIVSRSSKHSEGLVGCLNTKIPIGDKQKKNSQKLFFDSLPDMIFHRKQVFLELGPLDGGTDDTLADSLPSGLGSNPLEELKLIEQIFCYSS